MKGDTRSLDNGSRGIVDVKNLQDLSISHLWNSYAKFM